MGMTAGKRAEMHTQLQAPKRCFIVMPFGLQEVVDVYECFLKPYSEGSWNLRCERGNDLFGSNVVMDDIHQNIESAALVIADLTGRNPNVFYEIGIAHALKKEVLMLAQSEDDVPFDLRHRRILLYTNTPKGCKELEVAIVQHINAMLPNPELSIP